MSFYKLRNFNWIAKIIIERKIIIIIEKFKSLKEILAINIKYSFSLT